jgi:hypothetical protein
MKPVFDSDRLAPCNDSSHERSYLIDGVIDELGDPALVINCRECGRIFSSPERYTIAESCWFINAS